MATIAWSYDLLDEAERTLLRRLAIFRAPAMLEAVEGICASDTLPLDTVAETISSLVEKSLVDPVAGEERVSPPIVLPPDVVVFKVTAHSAAGERLAGWAVRDDAKAGK